MRNIIRLATVAAATALLAGTAAAQMCMGRQSYARGPVQFGLMTRLGGDASSVGGEFAAGAPNTFFGMGRITQSEFGPDGLDLDGDPEGTTVSLIGGYQSAFGRDVPGQFCPNVQVHWGNLDVVPGENLRRTEIAVGGTFGWSPGSPNDLHFVPFVGAAVSWLDRTLERDAEPDIDFDPETYFPLTAGVGLHFNTSFALLGDVTIPAGLSGSDPALGLRLVFSTGGGN